MMDQFQKDCNMPDAPASEGYLNLDWINPGLGVPKGCVSWLEISPMSSHTKWAVGKKVDLH